MARGFYQNTAAFASPDGTLKALAGISVFVYLPGTLTPASIYTGRTGATLATNPVITDATGIVEFYAEVGEYDVRFKDTNAVPRIADRTVAWECISSSNDGIPYSKIDTGSGIPITDLALPIPVASLALPIAISNLGTSAADLTSLLNLLGGFAAQPGDIKATARATAPTGWVLCQGQLLSIGAVGSTYNALFQAIGHAYNPPSGADPGGGNFRLPDLQGRVPVGVGTPAGAAGATAHTLGQITGEEKHTLTIAEMPTHTHRLQITQLGGASNAILPTPNRTVMADPDNYYIYPPVGGDGPHNNMQPFQVVNYVIKT